MSEDALPPQLRQLQKEVVQCRHCPRLVEFRERVAREKRRAYLDWQYWGKPVPSFGDPNARLILVGLAPGAHGANRTGRMFTGDRSGEFLYAALHRAGLASQKESLRRDDGLELRDTYITAAVRCVPPQNRPSAEEKRNCLSYLVRELSMLPRARVLLALGAIAWQSVLAGWDEAGYSVPRPRPRFGHGSLASLDGGPTLIGSYHPSQQNTQTGRLTAAMFDEVIETSMQRAGMASS